MDTSQVMTKTLKRVTVKTVKGKRIYQFYSDKVRKDSILQVDNPNCYQLVKKYAIHPRLITNKLPAEEKNPFDKYGFNPWKELAPGNPIFPLDDEGNPIMSEVIDLKYMNYVTFMKTTGFALIPFYNITDEILKIIDEEVSTADDAFLASLKFRFYNEHYLVKYENK